MTEQEAKKIIVLAMTKERDKYFSSSLAYKELSEATEMAIKALEEQVAKKPIMIGYRKDGEPVYDCGCCRATLKVADQSYCMTCGCKVDWE